MKPGCKTAYIAECKIAYSSDCKIAVASVRPLTMRTVKLFTETSIRFQRVSTYSMNCEFAFMYLLTAFLPKGLCPHIDNDPKNLRSLE